MARYKVSGNNPGVLLLNRLEACSYGHSSCSALIVREMK